MAVVAMAEMGEARKGKRTLGRFYLSCEDIGGGGVCFFVIIIYLVSFKVQVERMKTSPK